MSIERIAEGLVIDVLSSVITPLALAVIGAIFGRKLLRSLTGSIPGLRQINDRHEQLQHTAINNPECPFDFYALNFACLIFFSVYSIVFAVDMSNIFFNEDYGWGWYVFFFALSMPFSYLMGFIAGNIIKVSVHRLLEKELPNQPGNKRADNSDIPGISSNEAQGGDVRDGNQQ